MAQLANLPYAAALGFQQGQGMAQPNPLGDFIRMMNEYGVKKGLIREEVEGKKGLEVFKSQIEQQSPKYKAETAAYNALAEKRGSFNVDETVKQEAYDRYQKGDKSPEVMKALGLWVSPMEAIIAQNMGFGDEANNPPQVIGGEIEKKTGSIKKPPKPKYDPKTQRVEYSASRNAWRVVPK